MVLSYFCELYKAIWSVTYMWRSYSRIWYKVSWEARFCSRKPYVPVKLCCPRWWNSEGNILIQLYYYREFLIVWWSRSTLPLQVGMQKFSETWSHSFGSWLNELFTLILDLWSTFQKHCWSLWNVSKIVTAVISLPGIASTHEVCLSIMVKSNALLEINGNHIESVKLWKLRHDQFRMLGNFDGLAVQTLACPFFYILPYSYHTYRSPINAITRFASACDM